MPLPSYNLELTFVAVQLIADHLKQGKYLDVAALLNDIAAQVGKQDHFAEQKKLQQEVAAAAASIPPTPTGMEIIAQGEVVEAAPPPKGKRRNSGDRHAPGH